MQLGAAILNLGSIASKLGILMDIYRLRYPIIVAAAYVGIYFRINIYPGRNLIDIFGMSDERMLYLSSISSFTSGLFATLFALIAARLIGAGVWSALWSSFIVLLLLFFAGLVTKNALFTYASLESLRIAMPGYVVGVYFIVGVWVSIAQVFEPKRSK